MRKIIVILLLAGYSFMYSAEAGEETDQFFDAIEEQPYIADATEKTRLDALYNNAITQYNKGDESEALNTIFSSNRKMNDEEYKNQYTTLLTRLFTYSNIILSESFFNTVTTEVQKLDNYDFVPTIKPAMKKHENKRKIFDLNQKLNKNNQTLSQINETLNLCYPEKITDFMSFAIKYPALSSIGTATLMGLLIASNNLDRQAELIGSTILPALAMTALWGTSSTVIMPSSAVFQPHPYQCPVPPFLLTPLKLLPIIGTTYIGHYLTKTIPTIPSVVVALTAAVSTWMLDTPLRKFLGFEKYVEETKSIIKKDQQEHKEAQESIKKQLAELQNTEILD